MRVLLPIFLILCAASASLAQTPAADDEEGPITLPDAVMQQVVSRIIRWQFKPANTKRTVAIAEPGVKREWLPEVRNIEFILVPESEIENYKSGVFLFNSVQRDGKDYSINAGTGNFCEATGEVWRFNVSAGKVRLWLTRGGWGSGCSSAP